MLFPRVLHECLQAEGARRTLTHTHTHHPDPQPTDVVPRALHECLQAEQARAREVQLLAAHGAQRPEQHHDSLAVQGRAAAGHLQQQQQQQGRGGGGCSRSRSCLLQLQLQLQLQLPVAIAVAVAVAVDVPCMGPVCARPSMRAWSHMASEQGQARRGTGR